MITEGLIKSIGKCQACHLASTDEKLKPLIGKGVGRKYLIVGIAPSYKRLSLADHAEVMPFGDKQFTSYWLGKVLEEVKLTSNDYYLTNLMKCSILNNAKPSEQDWSPCISRFFFQELYLVCPEKIVCLGGVAYDILKGYKEKNLISIPIFQVYHQAYIARKEEEYVNWKEQWSRIINLD